MLKARDATFFPTSWGLPDLVTPDDDQGAKDTNVNASVDIVSDEIPMDNAYLNSSANLDSVARMDRALVPTLAEDGQGDTTAMKEEDPSTGLQLNRRHSRSSDRDPPTEPTEGEAMEQKLQPKPSPPCRSTWSPATPSSTAASSPRSVIILVKAGAPGDTIIDGGNEWYENTERRISEVSAKGLLYLGMGVSGGEDGARNWRRRLPGGRRTENRTEIGIAISYQLSELLQNLVLPLMKRVALLSIPGSATHIVPRSSSLRQVLYAFTTISSLG
nr:6-phosphogluconate dehydrogenase, decarboxylating 2, chloroplastic-like [Ipomoea batatas]